MSLWLVGTYSSFETKPISEELFTEIGPVKNELLTGTVPITPPKIIDISILIILVFSWSFFSALSIREIVTHVNTIVLTVVWLVLFTA